MNRREFLRTSAAAGAALSMPELLRGQTTKPESVKRVLIMFKCHFDAGFINTQAAVVGMYFNKYFPQAMSIAAASRESGRDPYVWTTGSWLVYEYLEQASPADRKRMETALVQGDLAWHGLPFSWQSELLDPSLIRGAVGLSKSLDQRFGKTTTGAKMTDVPGHTRGLVAPLGASGIEFLDIGVNAASTPPDVPSLFEWHDGSRAITVMYHHHDYGSLVLVPGSDLAVDIEVRNDNSGPHTPEEIAKIYARLRQQFPGAEVRAASLTEIANAIAPYRSGLPVVQQEIGDTWIYGVSSDPVKVARYREVARLRREWIGGGKFAVGDVTDLQLLRHLLLEAEHTWGTDTKTWLDFDHYTPHDLSSVIKTPHYQTVEFSWKEKRDDLFAGIATLPEELRAEATTRVAALKPLPPSTDGLEHLDPHQTISTDRFELAFDPGTGAIRHLYEKRTQRAWASAENPLALFCYQTLSQHDYDIFFNSYLKSKADWAPKDFGKPNIAHFGAESRNWFPSLLHLWQGHDARGERIVAELGIRDESAMRSGLVAWPQKMYLEVLLPNDSAEVECNFSWFDKAPNRLPEALWLTFHPPVKESRGWMMEKAGQPVSPLDVVAGGNRHMHAILNEVSYQDGQGRFTIESVDAPVVALGERHPVYFSNEQPDLAKGLHFSLYNNGWGTNYIQWFGEDMRFRFKLRTEGSDSAAKAGV
ncbi:DUF5054 domain-containing protein [Acidipila rosea]|nr:DUF5054 domain-containing protein [Acidipila rosea]